jgi:hypothetical protein
VRYYIDADHRGVLCNDDFFRQGFGSESFERRHHQLMVFQTKEVAEAFHGRLLCYGMLRCENFRCERLLVRPDFAHVTVRPLGDLLCLPGEAEAEAVAVRP